MMRNLTLAIIALAAMANNAKADPYPQNDGQYTRTGIYSVAHRGPDFAASDCVDTDKLAPFLHVDIRLIGDYVYAQTDHNKIAKQKWRKMNTCNRMAYGTYACSSNIPMPGAYVTQVVNIYPDNIRVTLVVLANNHECQIVYE